MLAKTRLISVITAAALVFATACGGGNDDDNILKGGGADSPGNPQSVAATLTAAANAQGTAVAGSTPRTSTTPVTSPTRTATATAGSTGTTTTLTGDAGDLQKALMNLTTQKSFRANVAADAGASVKFEVALEVALPDKLHITLKSAPSSLPAMLNGAEVIGIGKDLYIKVGGVWIRESTSDLGLGDLSTTGLSDLTSEFDDLGATTVVTKGSTDTVNGKRCQVYAIKDTADPTSTGDVCIADNLPQRLKVNFGGGSATITFSDFNANINIQKPI